MFSLNLEVFTSSVLLSLSLQHARPLCWLILPIMSPLVTVHWMFTWHPLAMGSLGIMHEEPVCLHLGIMHEEHVCLHLCVCPTQGGYRDLMMAITHSARVIALLLRLLHPLPALRHHHPGPFIPLTTPNVLLSPWHFYDKTVTSRLSLFLYLPWALTWPHSLVSGVHGHCHVCR